MNYVNAAPIASNVILWYYSGITQQEEGRRPMASIFGTALRKARKEKNLTQAEFADLLGISLISLQRYEQGTHRPSSKMVDRIRTKSGIDLSAPWMDDFQISMKEEPLTRAAAESLSLIQELNQEGQDAALYTLRMISRIPEFRKDSTGPGKE